MTSRCERILNVLMGIARKHKKYYSYPCHRRFGVCCLSTMGLGFRFER